MDEFDFICFMVCSSGLLIFSEFDFISFLLPIASTRLNHTIQDAKKRPINISI